MKIAIAQINSTIGDFSGNQERILDYSRRAKDAGADLVLFPELALCGYPPMDLLDQDAFTEENLRSLRILQRELPRGIAAALGFVGRNPYAGGKALVNQYGILLDGALVHSQIKTLLPTYDVFDEARNFESAREWKVFEYKGERIGVAICEDVWRETVIPGTSYIKDPLRELMDRGLTLLCVPSASPYVLGKLKVRQKLAERIGKRGDIPLVYINAVGSNDSIIFDGRSFVLDGETTLYAEAFKEDLLYYETNKKKDRNTRCASVPQCEHSSSSYELDILEQALVMGIRDYMKKCGFKKAHLGLSGGIDSALVAYLGAEAVGAENIAAFSMPSRFSSQGSRDDAADLAANLGIRYETLPIEQPFSSFLDTLKPVFEERPFDIAEENLQARIRGTLMMAYSNKFNSMLLTTGNKSELAMGYCTLYGDMCGALAVIGDLFKTEVFALCRRINQRYQEEGRKPPIPQAIITKPPSAELRPNQKDQDSLPPYEVLDEILKLYLFENQSGGEIVKMGYDEELVRGIIRTVARSEFKRRQAPPVLKVSQRAFGMGRRMPIARSIYEV